MPTPSGKSDFQYRYASETPEQRIQRHASFRESESDFLNPSVLDNLRITEPVAEEMYSRSRKWYEEDLAAAREKNPKAHYSFDAWLNDMALDFGRMDPKSEEGKLINPIGTAELYREFMRLHRRTENKALREELKTHQQKLGPAGQAALGVFSAADEFARTASGGASDALATLANRIVGGEKQAEKYLAGREWLAQLESGMNPTVRLARGFGGLLGFVTPAGGLSKMANAGKAAIVGGKTALKEGTWRYGLNKALSTILGASSEGAGIGARAAASAGNFLASDAALKTVRELSDIAQARMAGRDWRQALAELHAKPEWELLQSAVSGATMPFFQKVGDRVARMFMGPSGSRRRAEILGKSLKEMGDWGLRTQAILARGLGGSAEFAGLSLLPNLHDPNEKFGVAKDFALLFGEDSPERTAAIERLIGHAVNGFLLKNLHGKPVNEYAEKDRARANAPGVDRLGVSEAMVEAKRSAEDEANALFPDREMVAEIQAQREGSAYQKIADHVVRQYGRDLWGEEADYMSHKDIMDRLDPEQQKWVTDAINGAIRIVGSTGKGFSLRIEGQPDDPAQRKKPKVISYSKETAGRYGITEDERKAVRAAVREIVEASADSDRDEIAADLIKQQAVAEAAAGMGMGDTEKGAVDSVLSHIADSAAESTRTKEAAGAAKPEESIDARKAELEGLYRKIDAAQQAGRLDLARKFAEQAVAIETELDTLQKSVAPEPQAGTAENPLTPGVKPKPLAEPSPGDVTWPEGFAEQARGQYVRILVGQTSDKKGVFRGGHILYVEPETGIAIAQSTDGMIFAFTPADVAKGSVRGEVLVGIEPAPEPDQPGKPVDEATNALRIEREQITSRGDTIEPINKKPGAIGPQLGPDKIAGLLPSGPIDVTPAPATGSGEKPPKAGPTAPKAPESKPSPGPSVSPSDAKTYARLGSNRARAKGTGQGSTPTKNVAPKPAVSVEPKAGPPANSPPKPEPSTEARRASVPTEDWVKKAPDHDINAKIGAVNSYMRELDKQGRKDSDEYNGARSVLSMLAREAYARRNPKKPAAEAPKPEPRSTPETDAAFRAKAPEKEAAAPAAEAGQPATVPASATAPEAPARFGSRRKKASAVKHEAMREGNAELANTAAAVQAQGIIERQGKRIKEERKRARTDPLTGVSNNREEYMKSPRSKGKHWAVVDLTSLGLTNNNAGQSAGDDILKAAAKKIQELSGVGPETVFRGGKADEFYVAGDPEQIVKLGNAISDFTGEGGKIGERDTGFGKIHNRIVGGTGATVADAEASLARAKSEYAKHAKKQGYLDKTTDPSKGWRPSGGAGKAKAEGPFPSAEAASVVATKAAEERQRITDAGGDKKDTLLSLLDKRERHQFAPMVTSVTGKTAQMYLTDLPTGYKIVGAVKSGNSSQVILKGADGKTYIAATGKNGIKETPKDWARPENTKNVIVYNENGDVVYKGETVVETPPSIPEPEVETGRITTRDQAINRIGSFRRLKIEKGGTSGVTDPIRRSYDLAGALAADPSKTAEAVKVMEDDLYKRITKEQEKGASEQSLERLNAAYTAVRRVREAKQFIEELDRRILAEEKMAERTAAEINPARLISVQDGVMAASQQSAKELAVRFKDKVEEELERIRAGRNVKDLPLHLRNRYNEVYQLKKLADSLIFSSPVSKNYGRLDLSESPILPGMSLGDTVEIAVGGKEGGRIYRGIVVGSGEPSAASLKRGVGTSGQRLRELIDKERSGGILSAEERRLVESSSRFPGKWVTIFTDEGQTVRVRASDIVDVGPENLDKANFHYDPEKKQYGVEVTDKRFMSWFSPPEEAPKSRRISGSGDEEQAADRIQSLLDNEPEGYYVSVRQKDGTIDSRIITGEEAARLEAENTASAIRNRTVTGKQYRYQQMAILAPDKARKSVTSSFASRGEDIGLTAKERYDAMSPEEKAKYEETRGKGGSLPEDVYEIKTYYFEPGARLRSPDALPDSERMEYDRLGMLAEQTEAAERMRQETSDVYDKNRKQLVPLHIDTNNGEWLLQYRSRGGKNNVLREGQILLAERTPEGTIFVRRISPTEAEAWMSRRGKNQEWAEYRKESRREHARLISDNERTIAMARGETQLRDYMTLLRKQFDEIIDGRSQEFPYEGDLHRAVRDWVRENPAPKRNEFDSPEAYQKALADYKRDAEVFLFAPPHTERKLSVKPKGTGEEESISKYEATVEDADFIGKPRNEGGPMFRAAERVRVGREPNSGAPIKFSDDGRITYVHQSDADRDFYRAHVRPQTQTFGMFGLGYIPGGSSNFVHMLGSLVKGGLGLVDRALRAVHRLERPVASVYAGVMDGVTNTAQVVTDNLLFKHVHDMLHHPDYGSGLIGETGKAAVRKLGVLFGDSPVAPQMRIYHNDMEGDFYDVAHKAARALRSFSHLPREEQIRLIGEFEAGRTPEILKEYRDLIDTYGSDLVKSGHFTEDTIARYRGRYVHQGRWVWKQGDIKARLAKAESDLAAATTPQDKDRLKYQISMLKNALAKTTKSKTRVFIGNHPLDMVDRFGIKDMYRRGFARERKHSTVADAEKHGLDTSLPWLLLMDGLLVEGRAVAQAKMLKRVMSDPTIVKPYDQAPHDWIPIEGTRYSNDPIFKHAIGKSIEPQALSLIEAMNPDRSKFVDAWDMVSGLVKSGLTAYNPTNWHTQLFGNIWTLATRVPFFQIPSRLASAALTLAGQGKEAGQRLEKYKRWNWTRHTNDATREIARMLDIGAYRESEGAAIGENPYLGMGFMETVGEAMKRLAHLHVRSGLRGLSKAAIDFFTAFDSMARIALHEHLTETMRMDETEARKVVDRYFDIQHMPKGWQAVRRFGPQFHSIRATMGRNLNELVPNSPVAITNLSLLSWMWNLAVKGLTGMTDDEEERLADASIPNSNAFHNWIARKTAVLMPDLKGSARFMDMNRFSPTDTGIRSLPGLRPVVSGLENMLWEGKWAPSMEGKGVATDVADFASSNLIYGPTLDYVYDRDRFNEGRGVRKIMEEEGAFGTTGYLRYMIERGNLGSLAAAALPPGYREFAAGMMPTAIRTATRFGGASDAGFLGTKPRYVTETDKAGNTKARKYDTTDALLESLGFQLTRPDEYARIREALAAGRDVEQGRFGLSKKSDVERGSSESYDARQAVSDDSAIGNLNRGIRLAAMILHYNTLEGQDQKTVGEQIKKAVRSASSLKSMISQLALMEEYDLLRTITDFFEQDKGMEFIPSAEVPVERLTKGRFGSLRNK